MTCLGMFPLLLQPGRGELPRHMTSNRELFIQHEKQARQILALKKRKGKEAYTSNNGYNQNGWHLRTCRAALQTIRRVNKTAFDHNLFQSLPP